MFVYFILNPLVEKYKKIFNAEVMKSSSLIAEAHVKAKNRMSKFIPMEDGILRMVVDHLPSLVDLAIGHPETYYFDCSFYWFYSSCSAVAYS